MKKSLSRVLSLALALVMLLGAMPFALADDPVTPTYEVTVTASKTNANVGDVITFTATISPDVPATTSVSYDWSLTGTKEVNKLIYTVAENDEGKDLPVTVTVTVGDDTVTGSCSPVTVYDKPTDVTISGDSTVEVGKTLQLTGAVVLLQIPLLPGSPAMKPSQRSTRRPAWSRALRKARLLSPPTAPFSPLC